MYSAKRSDTPQTTCPSTLWPNRERAITADSAPIASRSERHHTKSVALLHLRGQQPSLISLSRGPATAPRVAQTVAVDRLLRARTFRACVVSVLAGLVRHAFRYRPCGDLGARRHRQFGQDVRYVHGGRLRRDEQFAADL